MPAKTERTTAPVWNDEAECVRRAQAGDTRAFEFLYRENRGRVYALCLRMTANPGLADELAQEAFVRAWEKLDGFRGESKFSTWLHRLTVNVVLGALRQRNRRQNRETGVEEFEALPAAEAAAPAGLRADLEAAIQSLPEGARRVFVLHDIEGYRHEDIAEMMGTATGTCKAQLHRARKLLRERLS
ncbi:MAG: sigma-70 family RNA polymerase sigma factor [Candidatus Hydrogenedens sp.]|nr:sigma-70 family RNA polymerase sigma factor [Candidatus Hydrogenedens sp.]